MRGIFRVESNTVPMLYHESLPPAERRYLTYEYLPTYDMRFCAFQALSMTGGNAEWIRVQKEKSQAYVFCKAEIYVPNMSSDDGVLRIVIFDIIFWNDPIPLLSKRWFRALEFNKIFSLYVKFY